MSQKYFPENYNCVVILGPTAVGKTGVGVGVADYYNGQIISADSRQVYKGLDIGSGKDLDEYILDKGKSTERKIPYHLIDNADVKDEYNVFNYQKDFYKVFTEMQSKNILPVIVGGTGMYLDSIVRGYDLVEVPTNQELRKSLAGKNEIELTQILSELKIKAGSKLHNSTDITERHRLLRAIEIEVFMQEKKSNPQLNNYRSSEEDKMPLRPEIKPIIIGTTFERSILRDNVTKRLKQRLQEGMIEEVKSIHDSGISWERLERLGLEYRFVAEFLQGKILTEQELFEKLNTAIHQFVKRQETWFRGMERKGVKIFWLNRDVKTKDTRVQQVVDYINSLK
ncbi:MAG: tRNA (adenosine(37)-N6)-dimethylallyltransferase MiaA [Treponemataceae bacterium]|nr:tRNA (adenosine(37)-N6)-dimethylallyltransferase MiaA [Treponemataceae bacterium]